MHEHRNYTFTRASLCPKRGEMNDFTAYDFRVIDRRGVVTVNTVVDHGGIIVSSLYTCFDIVVSECASFRVELGDVFDHIGLDGRVSCDKRRDPPLWRPLTNHAIRNRYAVSKVSSRNAVGCGENSYHGEPFVGRETLYSVDG